MHPTLFGCKTDPLKLLCGRLVTQVHARKMDNFPKVSCQNLKLARAMARDIKRALS